LVEAFRDLPAEHLAELERLLITQAVSRGEVLMRQGDAADALYLVASGRFAVNVDGRRIADVGSGSPIGEIGFFADGIRTATATALRDSIVLKLPKAEFAAFAERHPIILKLIAVTLARRLADTLAGDEQSLTHPRTLAVIGAGGFAVPDAFRKRLALALSRFGQIATVDSATLAAALSGGIDLDSEPVTSWFNRQEFRYHYLLYFADATLTPFSAKVIRQADQLLIVGDAAEAAPEPSRLERFAFDIHPASARRLVAFVSAHDDAHA
jgi:NTE family protein